MKKQPTVYNPISVKPQDVADLKEYFPSLTDYEAIHLLQQEKLIEKLEEWRQDFRKANVMVGDSVEVPPALESIAIILQDIHDQRA